jgi:hypothetical protein
MVFRGTRNEHMVEKVISAGMNITTLSLSGTSI